MKQSLIAIIFFISTTSFPQYQDKFIIGAEHVSSMTRFWGDEPVPHSDYYWDKVKEFGLNWAGLKYFELYPEDNPIIGRISKSRIIQDLDKAAARDIKVFLYNGFDHFEGDDLYDAQRWIYQFEATKNEKTADFLKKVNLSNLYDSTALLHWSFADTNLTGIPNYLRFIPGNHPYGLITGSLREKNLQPDGKEYLIKIKMRLPYAAVFENVVVCTVKITYTPDAEIEGYIYASDFSDNDWKEIPVKCFIKTKQGPLSCKNTIGANQHLIPAQDKELTFTPYDYQIIWNSTEPLNYIIDIDYLAVDDLTGHKLFRGMWDDKIDDAVKSEYRNHPAVLNFQVHDEVRTAALHSVRYINHRMELLLDSSKTPLSYLFFAGGINNPYPATIRSLYETGMKILMSDIYPIGTSTKTPHQAGYTEEIQSIFQNPLITFDHQGNKGGLKYLIEAANKFSRPFWFTVQAHKWDLPPNETYTREPSAFEIKAMANLGVCYGAKGIIYYLYADNWHRRDKLNGFYYEDHPDFDGSIREFDDYGYPKWEAIKQLNHKLAAIGDELLSLKWLNAYSIHQEQPDGYITNVQSYHQNISDPAQSTYIELGLFEKLNQPGNQNSRHFYIVNRRTLPEDIRNIRVNINKTNFNLDNYFNWGIKETGTTNTWTLPITGNFEAVYQPGEGKLFSLQPVVLDGGILQYDETITQEITLNEDMIIDNGAVLTLNADYNANGNITIRNGSVIYNGRKINFLNGKKIIK